MNDYHHLFVVSLALFVE